MIFCKPLKKRTILLIMLFFGYGLCYALRNVVQMALNVYGFKNFTSEKQEKAVMYFFYGYILLQIPCGRLSEVFGGKTLIGFGMLGASILTLFIPYAIHIGGYDALGIINVFLGVFLAQYNASVFNLASKWITVEERGKLVSSFSSLYLSQIMTLHFEYSWSKEILFIIPGVSGIIWTFCWYMLVYDSPLTHPSITQQEKKHIVLTKESEGTIYDRAIDCPYFDICFDPHVWVVIITHTCFFTGAIFINNRSSLYLLETFKLSPTQDPFLMISPFLLSFISSFLSGFLFTFLRSIRISLTLLQKTYTAIATILPAISFFGFILCQNNKSWTMFFYFFGLTFQSWIMGGHFTVFLDLAPNFAASLAAMSGTLATLSLVLSNKIIDGLGAGLERQEQWENRHSLISALYFTAGTMFVLFGNSNTADWNTPIVYGNV
ncbi:hypothetical protein LSTR_LSTR011982 [Laodelphax striatellus]|uniref:Major facilitator superfamily (MFS) profile domain-containing protein n=1 Tax=Laodelphax striatellus TaxID=195883 RepID=A0A482WZ18_LAOST|nr:hypothetical protein LSTR_LSTR011982 [Laodelphax striatellus]